LLPGQVPDFWGVAELVWNRIMAESAFEGKRSKLKNVFKGKRSMLEL